MNVLTLNNGNKIPALGLGTWFIDDDKAEQAVISAVKIGYRHIDTAQVYGNERGVGAGIRACGISRESLFVTSKVAAEAKTYDAAACSIDESLKKMGLAYIDLMLIHSPQPWAEWRSNKRYFEENGETYWHILDPETAAPARSGLTSVTVIGENGTICDGLSTALFVMGLEDGISFWKQHPELDLDIIWVEESGNVTITSELESTFQLTEAQSGREVTVIAP